MNPPTIFQSLSSILRFSVAVAILVLVNACSGTQPTVTVRLITGLVTGPEFRVVQTTVMTANDASATTRVVQTSEASAASGTDYSQGIDVASYALAPGSYRVRVRLLRPVGGTLVERIVALTLAEDTILPIHITRDCVGVECPNLGGDATLSTCLAGRCVDERCTPAAREFCPMLSFCSAATECGATSACAKSDCVEGLCTASPVQDACDATQWCNPDLGEGCTPLTSTTPTPFPCGTVCFNESTPCRFGYWRCDDSVDPVCEDLASRPVGFVCGAGRSCDAEQSCVPDVVTPAGVSISPRELLETSEAGAGVDVSVQLDTQPTANVTIGFINALGGEVSLSSSSLEFTPANWSTPQVLRVNGVDDFAQDGDRPFTVVTSNALSTDPRYSDLEVADITGVNHDDDSAGIVVSPTGGLVTTEVGGTATFTLTLATQPSANVVVALASSAIAEGTVLPASMTFTPLDWNLPQTATITGQDDAVLDGATSYTVTTNPAVSADANYAGFDAPDVSVVNLDDITQLSYVKASNPGTPDAFGTDLALSGDGTTLAIGAFNESSAATGINGNEADNSASYSGAVYVFVRSGSTWVQQAYIKASNTDAGDNFGYTIAISNDGDTLAVGALNEASAAVGVGGVESDDSLSRSGAVFVFSRAGTAWSQQAYVKASNSGMGDSFGVRVSVSGDGNTLAVAATSEDSAAMGVGGAEGDNSSSGSGAAYIFGRIGAVWSQSAYVKASNSEAMDGFGSALALASDGTMLAVGAGGEASDARGVNGDQLNNAAVYAGAVYVFTKMGALWSQEAYIKASNTEANDQFGSSLAISADGSTLAVGAYAEDSDADGIDGDQSNNAANSAGAVYVFTRTLAVWSQQAYLKASNSNAGDTFGEELQLSGDGGVLVVGASREDSNARGVGGDELNEAASASGAAYAFARVSTVWRQVAYAKSSNSDPNDGFGYGLGISNDGRTIVISAYGESSNATGVDGDATNNLATASGAVYVFAAD